MIKQASVGWALTTHHLVSLCFYKNKPSENQNLQTAFSNLLSEWA
ncbi:hypothetical protein ACFPVS_13300 [Neisseria weixii]|nr:hypothetical protein [Neisseria weixii]